MSNSIGRVNWKYQQEKGRKEGRNSILHCKGFIQFQILILLLTFPLKWLKKGVLPLVQRTLHGHSRCQQQWFPAPYIVLLQPLEQLSKRWEPKLEKIIYVSNSRIPHNSHTKPKSNVAFYCLNLTVWPIYPLQPPVCQNALFNGAFMHTSSSRKVGKRHVTFALRWSLITGKILLLYLLY